MTPFFSQPRLVKRSQGLNRGAMEEPLSPAQNEETTAARHSTIFPTEGEILL